MQVPARIALVGQPNVGKSVIMNNLTGVGAVVSNYAGTTVEITRGYASIAGKMVEVIDTPGTYTLHSDTEEQRVTQRILLEEDIDLIINVIDSVNLARSLYLTFQLLDFGIPMIVAANQADRAAKLGIIVDASRLQEELGVPVVPMVATANEGTEELRKLIRYGGAVGRPIRFSEMLESTISRLEGYIRQTTYSGGHSSRTLAIHLLEHDTVDEGILSSHPDLAKLIERLQTEMGADDPLCPNCFRGCAFCPARGTDHPVFLTCIERTRQAREVASRVTRNTHRDRVDFMERLEEVLDHPVAGLLAMAFLAWVSFRLITLFLGYAEDVVERAMVPIGSGIVRIIQALLPEGALRSMLMESVPEGLVIPFSVVFPAMLAVYVFIALLEDTGLLARFAVALDRLAALFGLPGQSVIPVLLGFGCRAPAVMATRILPDHRSRFIATALIGVTVPCAATLGILAGVVVQFQANAFAIGATIVVAFVLIGLGLSLLTAGEDTPLVLEVPPLRIPVLRNVIAKTTFRMKSFFLHVLPLLVVMNVALRALLYTNVLARLGALDPVTVRFFGVSGPAFAGVLITVVQRYLAPMVLLNLPLTAREATIASSMVALSFPCLPVTILSIKELGLSDTAKVFGIALLAPVIAALVLNLIL